MYNVTEKYLTAVKQPSRDFTGTYMFINNVKVTTDNIERFEINYSIGSSDKLTFGNANTTKISVSVIVSQDTPAHFANSVIPYAVLTDGTEEHVIKLGEFIIDKESLKKTDLLVTFDAYDAMHGYEYVLYNRVQCTTTQQLLNELVSYYDVKVHEITSYDNLEWKKTLEGLTVRQIIQELAVLYGSNAIIDREGYLKFVKPSVTGFSIDESNYINFQKENDELSSITKVTAICTVMTEEEETTISYSKGDTTGAEIEIETDNITTQEELDALYSRISLPLSYQAYELKAQGFPHLDCGDILDLTTVKGETMALPIVSHTLTFSGSFISNFKAAAIFNSVKGKKTSIAANIANLKDQINSVTNSLNNNIANTEQEISDILDDLGLLQDEVKGVSDSAAKAQVSADGKNKVFYASSPPTLENGLKENDLWFNTSEGNCSYRWNGTQWEKKAFGNAAIDNVDAGKITAGIISADRIAANTILAKILSVGGLSSDYINVNTLSAISSNLGTVTAGVLNASNGNLNLDLGTGALSAKKLSITTPNFTLTENGVLTSTGSASEEGTVKTVIAAGKIDISGAGMTNTGMHVLGIASARGTDIALEFDEGNYSCKTVVKAGEVKAAVLTAVDGASFPYVTTAVEFLKPITLVTATLQNNGYLRWFNKSGLSTWQVGLSNGDNAHLFSQGGDGGYAGSLTIGHVTNNGTYIRGRNVELIVADDGSPRLACTAVYLRTYSSGATVTVTSAGTLGRISSASKYKLDIDVSDKISDNILSLIPKMWFDKTNSETYADALTRLHDGEITEDDLKEMDIQKVERQYGLIAEDLEAAGLSHYCIYDNKTGEVEGIQYDRLWIDLLPIVKNLQDKVNELENKMIGKGVA